jgi:hypothetical protein
MSFTPFYGGKRICLGKTFAESMAKAIVSIVACQLDFNFINPTDAQRKQTNAFFIDEPLTKVIGTIAK